VAAAPVLHQGPEALAVRAATALHREWRHPEWRRQLAPVRPAPATAGTAAREPGTAADVPGSAERAGSAPYPGARFGIRSGRPSPIPGPPASGQPTTTSSWSLSSPVLAGQTTLRVREIPSPHGLNGYIQTLPGARHASLHVRVTQGQAAPPARSLFPSSTLDRKKFTGFVG